MSTYETHPALRISFSGEPGQACQTFIDHVTEYAFENNKQADDEWIADFAGMRLRGEALLWFAELDNETQESWRKLRIALVRAFRPASNTAVTSYRSLASPSISPTPAAAPPFAQAITPDFGSSKTDLTSRKTSRKSMLRKSNAAAASSLANPSEPVIGKAPGFGGGPWGFLLQQALREPASISEAPKPQPNAAYAEALYDFTSEDATDLHFSKGARILIVEKNNEDWWTGKLYGKQGLFPSAYVKVL